MSLKLTLQIKGGNDAVEASEDFAELLINAAEDIAFHDLCEKDIGSVHYLTDRNGNCVGSFRFEKE